MFEFRKKAGAPNFIRFPLFPGAVFSVKLVFMYFSGSLLLMEGAVQEDWLHCLPKVGKMAYFHYTFAKLQDPPCKEERVNLTFRTMYSADHVS